jgi:hypothetical protein
VSEPWPLPRDDRHGSHEAPPATSNDITEAEERLGVRFPDDYRSFLLFRNGVKGWFGEVYVELNSVDDVVELTEVHDHQLSLPGLVFIGGDGAREAVGYDFRKVPPPVVLIGLVSDGWQDASLQAPSFTEFMAQRRRGEEFSWTEGYE